MLARTGASAQLGTVRCDRSTQAKVNAAAMRSSDRLCAYRPFADKPAAVLAAVKGKALRPVFDRP